MTFGYCFSPCGPKLATGWNGLEPSWLTASFFFKFGERLEMEFLFWRFFFSKVIFSGFRGQIFAGFLALATRL
jgi:hypothetical protein